MCKDGCLHVNDFHATLHPSGGGGGRARLNFSPWQPSFFTAVLRPFVTHRVSPLHMREVQSRSYGKSQRPSPACVSQTNSSLPSGRRYRPLREFGLGRAEEIPSGGVDSTGRSSAVTGSTMALGEILGHCSGVEPACCTAEKRYFLCSLRSRCSCF